MPPLKMGGGCNAKSTFEMPPTERPVFDNCEWCEENCAECIACYDGKTVFYEEDMDRCERIGGPCGYPFGSKDICTQTCSPVMVKGAEGLHCVEGSASFSEMMLNEAFCQARDPSLATIYGVDPVGGPGYGRVAPNLYLPKGYTDPANANKSWPLLMTLTGLPTTDLKQRCRLMLKFPDRPGRWQKPGVPDEAAGEWDGAAVAGLAQISALLTDQYEEDRMPFAEALQKLEALAAAAAAAEEAAAGADAAPSGSVGDGEERCCIVCEEAPREVRFACGHALVCRGCLPVVVERHRKCPNCGVAFGTHPVVEQGEHVRSGPTFVLPA